MNHPFADNLSQKSDLEIDEALSELTKKFFQTRNPEAQNQISLLIDTYKLELSERQVKARLDDSNNKDLDNLINIS
jgi:hypothetical protein|tara:strand:- start:8298 stop:8525 length:228 start_codon:yes stop_codon:yes gene_type:complete